MHKARPQRSQKSAQPRPGRQLVSAMASPHEVIPGRALARTRNPATGLSILGWIPGSALTRRPGMTACCLVSSLRRDPARLAACGDQLLGPRHQLAAVFNAVDQGIEAADQEDVDAEVVVL